jgi:glucosyl-3-phosphoglycerate synthase
MTIRTARWDDWTLDDLLAAKGETTVSLVVPARNEAATVGEVVARVRERLVDTVALVDEIVVIDSDSTDGTADVAIDAGATVHRCAEIRPELGSHPGKGEAM